MKICEFYKKEEKRYMIKLVDYFTNKKNKCCENRFTIQVFFEYYNKNLSDINL